MKALLLLALLVVPALDVSAAECTRVTFTLDLQADPKVSPGQENCLDVDYAPMRFRPIMDCALQAQPCMSGMGYASKFHCYGYGCCKQSFPWIQMSYRLDKDTPFETLLLSWDGKGRIELNGGATKVEVYFRVGAYEQEMWACHGGGAETPHTHHRIEQEAWDSRYGQNYLIPLLR